MARTEGLADILPRAFGVGAEIDTNAYRKEFARLGIDKRQAKTDLDRVIDKHKYWQRELDALQREQREAKENEIAYQTFASRSGEFPEDCRKSPLNAKAWVTRELQAKHDAISAHDTKVGQLTICFAIWIELTKVNPGMPLANVLQYLVTDFNAAKLADEAARKALSETRKALEEKKVTFAEDDKALRNLEAEHKELAELKALESVFIQIFGDCDPELLNPQKALAEANKLLREHETRLESANQKREQTDRRATDRVLYTQIFGDADPEILNPATDLKVLREDISIEQQIISEHQQYAEALQLFEDAQPGVTPSDWLSDTACPRFAWRGVLAGF